MKRNLLTHLISFGAAAVFTTPLLWLVIGSLRPTGLPPPRGLEVLFQPLTGENYHYLFKILPFGRYLLNSLTVAALAVPPTLLTASWAAFGMSQLDSNRRRHLLALSFLLLLTPVTTVWLTRLVLFRRLGLLDTYGALLMPALMGTSPLFVLLFYWNFRRLPVEIIESARLDGAGVLQIWRHIAMPAARPTIVAVGVLTFITYWGDFIGPLLYLKSPRLYTLPVGLQQLAQFDSTNWPLLMAAAVVTTIPPIVLFVIAQRRFWNPIGMATEGEQCDFAGQRQRSARP